MAEVAQKNIYYELKSDSYCVQVIRNKSKFYARVHTLEEAIALKNMVLKFYKENGRIPRNSELNFESYERETTYGKYITFNKASQSFKLVINREGKRIIVSKRDVSELYPIRERILEFYDTHKRLPKHSEIGVKLQHPIREEGDSTKYITRQNTYIESYSIKIVRADETFLAYTHSLPEAMEVRDSVLEFYKLHHRLPSHAEIGFVSVKKRK